ncbi:MAG: PhoU domain-containing protein [Desulfurococcaceae archaeon]
MSSFSSNAHKKLHAKSLPVRYKPDSVRNILENIWGLTNISVDLAFYAYFAKDTDLAYRILDLDGLVADHLAQFVMHTAMAYGRSREAGYASLLSFYYGSAIDIISDSVKDIIYFILANRVPKISYDHVVYRADGEIVVKLTAEKDFKVIDLTDKYPVDIILVVEGDKHKFAPKPNDRVRKNSIIYLRGFSEPVLRLLNDRGIKYKLDETTNPELDHIVKDIVDIKDMAILMLDLAHYVLMNHSPELREEVKDLELQVDLMHSKALDSLRDAANKIDPDTYIGLITILKELEDIADASDSIGQIPALQEVFPREYKELFNRVFESIGEKIRTVTASKTLELYSLNRNLKRFGGRVLAVKTRDSWVAYPFARDITLSPGDKLIVVYQEEFSEELDKELNSML